MSTTHEIFLAVKSWLLLFLPVNLCERGLVRLDTPSTSTKNQGIFCFSLHCCFYGDLHKTTDPSERLPRNEIIAHRLSSVILPTLTIGSIPKTLTRGKSNDAPDHVQETPSGLARAAIVVARPPVIVLPVAREDSRRTRQRQRQKQQRLHPPPQDPHPSHPLGAAACRRGPTRRARRR
jgi:hypothetical protein